MIAPQAHGAGDGTADDGHDHWQAGGRGHAGDLMHQSQAVRGTGGESSHAGRGSADDGAQSGVLGLHRDVGGIILLRIDQRGDGLHDGGLRGDGVRCDQLYFGTHNAVSDCCVTV